MNVGDRVAFTGSFSDEVYRGRVVRLLTAADTWWVKPGEPWAEVRVDSFPEVFEGIPIECGRLRRTA